MIFDFYLKTKSETVVNKKLKTNKRFIMEISAKTKENIKRMIEESERFLYVDFPEHQILMELEGYDDNCSPADDGGCIVAEGWLKSLISE